MDKQEVDRINRYLKEKYGSFHDQPRFRLTWTNDHFEVRRGTFGQIWSGIIVAEVEDVRKVHKYSYCLNRWLLEELMLNSAIPAEILDQKLLSYEPRLLFQNLDTGEYEEPTLLRIDQACYFRCFGSLKGHRPTEEQITRDREAQSAFNRGKIRELIDEAITDTSHALVHGHGVVVPDMKGTK